MNKSPLKYISWGIIIIMLVILVIVCSFHYYTNKADNLVKNVYAELSERLQAKTLIDENGNYSNIIISINEDIFKNKNTNNLTEQFEKYLVAHYDAQTFWLNTWITIIGVILAVVTFVAPMLFMRWHEGKMREIDRDLEKFKDEKDKLLNDLKLAKEETEKSKLEAEKSSFRANLYRMFNKVDSLINSSMYKEAFDILEDISKNDLTDSEKALVFANRGTIAYHLNDISLAIDSYISATKMDPVNAMLFNTLGFYYFSNKQYDLAKGNYLTAIKLAPNIVLFWRNLCELYTKLGDAEEYYKCLQQIIKLSPQDSLAFNNIGTYLLSLGKKDEAEEYYQKSIELDPQNAYLAYSNMGYIYNIKGRFQEAIIYTSKGISIRPDVALPYANIAMSYLMIGDFKNAIINLNIFLNKKEIETVYYAKGDPFIEEIKNLIKNFLDTIPPGNDLIVDLIKKAMQKFEDHAMRVK